MAHKLAERSVGFEQVGKHQNLDRCSIFMVVVFKYLPRELKVQGTTRYFLGGVRRIALPHFLPGAFVARWRRFHQDFVLSARQ